MRAPAAVLAALALLAGLVLFRSARSASDLEVVPDSVEYALGARRIACEGSYYLSIEGRRLPPRYTPWFSLLLSPAYRLTAGEVGSGIYVVLLFAVAGVLAAWRLGALLGGCASGAFAALALLVLPSYRFWSGEIMTDGPCCALALASCALYVGLEPDAPPRSFLVAAVLAGLSAALRPATAALLLPFFVLALRSRSGKATRTLALLLPASLVLAATAFYHLRVFGTIWRSGYKFWCPVPYDYPSLLFSPSYVLTNLFATVLGSGFPFMAAAAGVLLWPDRKDSVVRRAAVFIALFSSPLLLVHLLYFYPAPRFALAPNALCAALAAALVGRRLRVPHVAIAPALLALAAVAAFFRFLSATPAGVLRAHAEALARATPPDAIVVTAINPVYLEPFLLEGSRRRVVPLSRDVEYASKLVAWRKVEHPRPPPAGPYDHRCAGLAAGGAEQAVAYVASEQMEDLKRRVAAAAPVYLDAWSVPEADRATVASLESVLRFEPAGERLFRLRPAALH